MKDINEMSFEDLLSEEVFIELFDMLDPVKRTRTKQALEERAKELKISTKFKELYKAYLQIDQEKNKKETEKRTVCTLDNYTNFTGDYDRMACGGWIANDTGIFAQNSGGVEEVACYHPILPVERLKNLETGEEQIKLAYKRNGRWNEIIVPKTMITSVMALLSMSPLSVSAAAISPVPITKRRGTNLLKLSLPSGRDGTSFWKVLPSPFSVHCASIFSS